MTWLPYVFDRLDTEYHDRARALGFKMKPSDYFRRQGYVTYQQDKYLEPIVPLIGEDNIIWGPTTRTLTASGRSRARP